MGTDNPVILLVEPNLNLSSIVASALSRERYEVLSATGAEHALEISRNRAEIALLITDVFLFGASGLELADKVRDRHGSAKLLLVSSMSEGALLLKGVPEGARVLEKPLALSDLVAAVKELLEEVR